MKKKNLLSLFMLLLSLSVFTGCNDDEKGSNGEELVGEIAGTYLGTLNVSLPGLPFDPIEQQIYISQDELATAKLELKDFSIVVGEILVEVGDITIPNVKLEGNASSVTLQETKTVINHPSLSKLDVTASGTVINGTADLKIVVQTGELLIDVAFKGDKINLEVKDNAMEVAAWYALKDFTITGADIVRTYPKDGIAIDYKGYNKISIPSTMFSFAPKGKTIYFDVESADVVEKADGIYILPIEKTFDSYNNKNIKLKLSGKIVKGELILNVQLSDADYTLNYVFTGEPKQTGATINKMTLSGDAIMVQPEISTVDDKSKANVAFYVKSGTADDKLKSLVPTFELAEGAKLMYNDVEYVAGTPMDFSKEQIFKVKAESGKTTNTYTVSKTEWVDYEFKHNMDTWVAKKEYQEPANGWGTSNEGIWFLKLVSMYPSDAPFIVTPSDDAKSGQAARVETVYTKGGDMGFVSVPVVTSGTVFNGAFITDAKNTLNSTKFGYPCLKKPIAFKGSYKYAPGKDYYFCPDPKKAHSAAIDKTKTDVPAMNAVLYEVNSYAFDVLTGENLLTSDRIVAIASVDGKAQTSYTDFNVTFKFSENKAFDATKKYKLAIVCSSSKDGDKFSGAPGSVLFVDNLEVTF